MQNLKENLIEFLNKAHSQYHSVALMKEILKSNGYIELFESEDFTLEPGKNYFTTRNLTSIIAFSIPENLSDLYFKIVASHTDSPCFKVKENPTLIENGYEKLKVEGYGGMIKSVWLDKPLSIAGRIVVESKNGLESRLVNIDKDLAIIPNVAIHQNRTINDGFSYNAQVDLCPIIGLAKENGTNFEDELYALIEKDEKIISTDLFLYNRESAKLLGSKSDLFVGPKLDDLASGFLTLKGTIEASKEKHQGINVFLATDNEEVGSLSINGADSTFLHDTLDRIIRNLGLGKEDFYKAIAKSFLISADNAHAIHPNHPELSDNKNIIKLGEGIVIKHNANMLYTTDALSSSVIKKFCEKANIKYQEFFNRSDVRGGSTLGNISNSHVSLLSADIGIAQLAMHSNYETMGASDVEAMFNLIKEFMKSDFNLKNGNFLIK